MKKIVWTVCIGLCIEILLNGAYFYDYFSSIRYRASEMLYRQQKVSEDIIIVGIDRFSQDEAMLGKFKGWTRDYYAQVIRFLSESGAKVIGIDLLFSEKSRGIGDHTLKDKNNPLTFESFERYAKEPHPYDESFINALTQGAKVVLARTTDYSEMLDGNLLVAKRSIGPLQIFKEHADEGWITIGGRDNDRVFSVSAGYQYGNEFIENFSFAIARKYLGIKQMPLSSSVHEDFYMFYEKPKIVLTLNNRPLEEESYTRDITIPIHKSKMLIKYNNLPKTYKYVPFGSVYVGKVPKDVFKNKIALIGFYDYQFGDHYLTPISNQPMFGIEIRANAIQNIIEQNFLAHQKEAWKIATIALITLMSVFVFSYLNIIISLIYLPLSFAVYYAYARFQFDRGILVDMLYPFVAIVLSFVSIYVYKYLTEYKSKLALKNAFSRYVNAEVVKEIMKHPDQLKLGGEKRIITVFFSDIKGFTSVSENLQPEQLVELLNGYLEAMTSVILKNGGTVDKYEGDAIMAFWNAPLSLQDHAFKACKSAWDCRMKLTELHKEWKKIGKPLLDFRVGINTGEAIVGNIGSTQKFEYTAIGDTVNLASRLEGVNKVYGTNILISQFTKEMVEPHFVLRPADLLRVKGKKEAVFAYEIVCLKEDLTPTLNEFLKQFNEGFNFYLKGIFSEAHKVFYALSRSAPNDALTKVYLTRCGEFMEKKPENWDGVWVMRGK